MVGGIADVSAVALLGRFLLGEIGPPVAQEERQQHQEAESPERLAVVAHVPIFADVRRPTFAILLRRANSLDAWRRHSRHWRMPSGPR
jgi:hypothetical protein